MANNLRNEQNHALANQKQLFGHPVGLYILFMTEMWERFSYYGMRAILVLFLTSTTKGGLGWTEPEALSLYGIYTMLVYVMSIPGGIIADKFLGQKKSVVIGGFLLVAGHLLLAYTEMWAFYTALGLIILGVGFLKPNISTMVGGLYRQGDSRRDAGFIIFYMGINLGAFLSALIVGYVGEKIGWHYGFALAGFGMILGQVIFLAGQKHLKGTGDFVGKTMAGDTNEVQNAPFTKIEKDRIKVILISFAFILIFWAAFEQAGGFMNLFTKQYSDRFVTEDVRIDEYRMATVDSAKFEEVKVVIENKASPEIESIGDLFNGLFKATPKTPAELKAEIASKTGVNVESRTFVEKKDGIDSALYSMATTDAIEKEDVGNETVAYDLNNDQSGFIVPTSWFQSLNALFILMFGGVFAALWTYLAKRNKEPSTIFKFGLSTIIVGTGFLFMVFASMEKETDVLGKSSMWWLVMAYLFHTLGELFISPIALSFITKVSPKRIVASMMGLYFAVTGLGNFAASKIGAQAEKFGDFNVFMFLTIFSIAVGVFLIMGAKKLMKLTHGAEENDSGIDHQKVKEVIE